MEHNSLKGKPGDCINRAPPDLGDADLSRVEVEYDEARRLITVTRGSVFIACNLSAEKADLGLPAGHTGKGLLLGSHREIALHPRTLSLPPESVAVVSLAEQ